jgi:hypothetical protein
MAGNGDRFLGPPIQMVTGPDSNYVIDGGGRAVEPGGGYQAPPGGLPVNPTTSTPVGMTGNLNLSSMLGNVSPLYLIGGGLLIYFLFFKKR